MSHEIWRDIVIDPENTFALKTTWRDNKFYNGQYKDDKLRRKMKIRNPRKYGVQCNGNWGVLGELIYENWEVKECSKDFSYYDDISCGLDYGFGHNTAFHLVGYKDGDIYALKELYKPQLTVSDIIDKLKKMFPSVYEHVEEFKKNINQDSELSEKMQIFYKLKTMYKPKCKDIDIFGKEQVNEYDFDTDNLVDEIQAIIGPPYGDLIIYADNSRPEAIEEMRRQGFSGIKACTKGPNSVVEGIDWLQDRFIYIDESCIGLHNEIESYQWEKDKKTGERLPKPVKVNDDCEDSCRYACERFRNPDEFRVTVI
jgi:phage terminase large subunit